MTFMLVKNCDEQRYLQNGLRTGQGLKPVCEQRQNIHKQHCSDTHPLKTTLCGHQVIIIITTIIIVIIVITAMIIIIIEPCAWLKVKSWWPCDPQCDRFGLVVVFGKNLLIVIMII